MADFDEKTGEKGPIPVMSVSTITPNTTENLEHDTPAKSDTAKKDEVNKNEQDSIGNPASLKSESTIKDKPLRKGRVVVTGSSLFAANRFFKLQGNADLFLNTVSWLAEDENLIAIRPKSEKAQPIVLTANQSLLSFLIPVLIVPLIWIVAGVAVFVYRRKPARA